MPAIYGSDPYSLSAQYPFIHSFIHLFIHSFIC